MQPTHLTIAIGIALGALFLSGCDDNPEDPDDPDLSLLGQDALDAWELGESTGDFAPYLALLSDDFNSFQHPFVGDLEGPQAREAMLNFIAEKAEAPDDLVFSQRRFYVADDAVACQFESSGTLAGGAFEVQNVPVVIVFTFRDGRITGFSEHLAFFDPAWFQPQ